MDLGLKGKQVFITGGSVGIGLAVAGAFAREGATVVIGARNKERVEREAHKIAETYSVDTLGISMDVTKPEDISRAEQEIVRTFGGLDILINNAGVGTEETIMEAPDEKWYHIWDLHVMAAIRTARTFVPYMRKRGRGVILNTASICATQPLYYEPIYNTTKAALAMMGKCLANELIPDNIRVNTINPGLILTPDWLKTASILAEKEGITAQAYLDKIAKENTPIQRFATPEELADFYVFMASDRASYCVGSTYYVDGGWLNVAN
jgi:NAD(P)-dependent dehydrogenase (short-subunit alcohol dehydrogenase family)